MPNNDFMIVPYYNQSILSSYKDNESLHFNEEVISIEKYKLEELLKEIKATRKELLIENQALKEELKNIQNKLKKEEFSNWAAWKKYFFNLQYLIFFVTIAFVKGTYFFFSEKTGISPKKFWELIFNYLNELRKRINN